MGYDVHITRKDDWSDEEGPEISLAEWLAVVDADPEMRLEEYAETRLDSEGVLRMKKKSLSVWTAYSQHDESGNKAWFFYRNGEVVVKNPDEENSPQDVVARAASVGQGAGR
jgi:hypothetical protein